MPPMPATTSRRNRVSHKVLVVTALFLSGFACATVAQDDYPNRPLRIVVGFTPGGGPDITARYIAQRLGESLKQQVIVENRPGAGGTVAASMVARSPVDAVHVPHKGIPEALGETVAGRVQFFMAPIANAVKLVRDGRLVGLGVSSRVRDALLPELPTIDEAGVAGYEQELWFGLLAPSGVPRGIMARLNAEIGRILADADTKARWAPIGIEPRPPAPPEFARLVASEIALYTRIARAANITSQ